MKFTYYGHACFGIEVNGKHLLFDPFISQNELAKHIDIKKIKADYIFISHGHFDHVADALAIANNTGATIVANFEIYTWFTKQGIKNTHPMNHGGSWKFDFGKAKMVDPNERNIPLEVQHYCPYILDHSRVPGKSASSHVAPATWRLLGTTL